MANQHRRRDATTSTVDVTAHTGTNNDAAVSSDSHSVDSVLTGGTADDVVPPFPYRSIFVLAATLLANALFVTSLFPYLPFLAEDMTGLTDERDVGFKAGYIASSFMAGRVLSATVWGVWSDKHGRKPVLLAGCLTIAITSIAFGFSFSYWWTIVIRFIGGLGNGITSAAKVCASEVAHPTHQAKAMGVVTASWGAGLVLGPAIGGLTSRLHVSSWTPLRSLAPEGSLLYQFPYLLPNVILCGVGILAAVSLCWLPETLEKQPHKQRESTHGTAATKTSVAGKLGRIVQAARGRRQEPGYARVATSTPASSVPIDGGNTRVRGADVGGADAGGGGDGIELTSRHRTNGGGGVLSHHGSVNNVKEEAELAQLMSSRSGSATTTTPTPFYRQLTVVKVVLAYTLLSFVQIVFDEAMPLWAVVAVDQHGLGMDTTQIGAIMTATGVGQLLFQAFIYPCIASAYGTRATFIYAGVLSIPLFLLFPLCGLATTYATRFAGIVTIYMLKNAAAMCLFTSVFIMVNNCVVPSHRGTINGFAVTIASIGKAAAPAVAGNLFAWSMENGLPFPLDFHLVYILSAIWMGLLAWLGVKLPVSLDQPKKEHDDDDGDRVSVDGGVDGDDALNSKSNAV